MVPISQLDENLLVYIFHEPKVTCAPMGTVRGMPGRLSSSQHVNQCTD